MTERKRDRLDKLLAQCNPESPVPEELGDWEQSPPIGLEQLVIQGQVDIRNAVLVFTEKLVGPYEVMQVILFGSRARGEHHPESDADVAVILRGESGNFVETKLSMAGLAFDALVETGVLIQAFPVWEDEWRCPDKYSNAVILKSIAQEGVIIWQA